jgi:hypothetical protein
MVARFLDNLIDIDDALRSGILKVENFVLLSPIGALEPRYIT